MSDTATIIGFGNNKKEKKIHRPTTRVLILYYFPPSLARTAGATTPLQYIDSGAALTLSLLTCARCGVDATGWYYTGAPTGSLLSEASAAGTCPGVSNFRLGRVTGWRRVFTHPATVMFDYGIAIPETKVHPDSLAWSNPMCRWRSAYDPNSFDVVLVRTVRLCAIGCLCAYLRRVRVIRIGRMCYCPQP